MFFPAQAAGDRSGRASDAGGEERDAPDAQVILRSSAGRVGCAITAAGAVFVAASVDRVPATDVLDLGASTLLALP